MKSIRYEIISDRFRYFEVGDIVRKYDGKFFIIEKITALGSRSIDDTVVVYRPLFTGLDGVLYTTPVDEFNSKVNKSIKTDQTYMFEKVQFLDGVE